MHPDDMKPRRAVIHFAHGVVIEAGTEQFTGEVHRDASITAGWVHIVGTNDLGVEVTYSVPSEVVTAIMWVPKGQG